MITLTTNEFEGFVYTIPKDLDATAPKFIIDNNGYSLVCELPAKADSWAEIEISLFLGTEEIELTPFQWEVVRQVLWVNVNFT